LTSSNCELYNGLIQNSSIKSLNLRCRSHRNALDEEFINNEVAHEILRVYQQNNNLTFLSIEYASHGHILQNGVNNILATTLRHCTNLKKLYLWESNVTDEQIIPLVDAMRGLHSLGCLHLAGNRIGNTGCEAISILLCDPNSRLNYLNLSGNQINNEGATTIINSLASNTKLQELLIGGNPTTNSIMQQSFSRLLCNVSSLNSIYNSNHTLVTLSLSDLTPPHNNDLLILNKSKIKSHVAIRKILKYHPNIDMEQLFELGSEGELSLKGLPYILDWFNRAGEAIEQLKTWNAYCSFYGLGYERTRHIVSRRKLSAIYQFAQAMPLLFVPTSVTKIY